MQKKLEDEYINNPLAIEEEIKTISADVARKLAFNANQTAKIEFKEHYYVFKAKHIVQDFKNIVTMFVIDEEMKALAEKTHGFYKPFAVMAEITNSMTLTDNLAAIVESFFRHTLDMSQAEALE